METVSVNQFRAQMKNYVEQIASDHTALKVTRRCGGDFIVMNAEDWERDQETLHILQNANLMQQIADSARTHVEHAGHTVTDGELDALLGL